MRRKPELSDSTLRWKGTEPTASTVKNRKIHHDLPKMSMKLVRWLEAALSFYTILASRFSTNIIWKKKIHILHAWKKCTCTHVVTTRQTNCHSSWWRLQQLKERKSQVESRKRKNEKEEVGKKKTLLLHSFYCSISIPPPYTSLRKVLY
jgi:hypothetical protein